MITRNWYNAFKAYRAKTVLTGALKNVSGQTVNAGCYDMSSAIDHLCLREKSFLLSASVGEGIVVGSGTTPPTLDDYKLESQITTGLSAIVATTLDADNDMIYAVTITNTSSEDITICEIGMHSYVYTSNSSSSATCLVERTVLENPITIPASGIGLINYAIKLTIPQE